MRAKVFGLVKLILQIPPQKWMKMTIMFLVFSYSHEGHIMKAWHIQLSVCVWHDGCYILYIPAYGKVYIAFNHASRIHTNVCRRFLYIRIYGRIFAVMLDSNSLYSPSSIRSILYTPLYDTQTNNILLMYIGTCLCKSHVYIAQRDSVSQGKKKIFFDT